MLGIFQIPAALPVGLTLAVKNAAGALVPATDLFTDQAMTTPFAANPTTIGASGEVLFYAASGWYQVVLGGAGSAADLTWNGGAEKTLPLAPINNPLAAATQPQAQDPAGTTLLNWTAQRIHQAIAYALNLWKSIAGQRDILTVLAAPADGGTVTVDCSIGNAFQITPTDAAGMDYVVDFINIPAGLFAITLITITGTNLPSVTYKVGGVSVTPKGTPAFVASKDNEWTVRTRNQGTKLIITGAAY